MRNAIVNAAVCALGARMQSRPPAYLTLVDPK